MAVADGPGEEAGEGRRPPANGAGGGRRAGEPGLQVGEAQIVEGRGEARVGRGGRELVAVGALGARAESREVRRVGQESRVLSTLP